MVNSPVNKVLRGLVVIQKQNNPGGMDRVIRYVRPCLEEQGVYLLPVEVANHTTFIRSIGRIFLRRRLVRKPDFVIFNSLASLGNFKSVLIHHMAKLLNIPQFIYWHEMDAVFDRQKDLRPKRAQKVAMLASFPGMHHMTVSLASQQAIFKQYGVNPALVYGGSEIPPLFNTPVQPSDDPPTVIGIGTIQYIKGVDLFVETAIQVCEKHPTVEFVWLGQGKDFGDWKQLLEASGYKNRILFLGYTDNPFLLLRRASVFFLSSRQDSFPLVNLEAMALARKIVTFRSGGAVEALSGSGWVIDNFDTHAAAQAILDILEIPKEQRLDTQARQRYLNLYTPAKLAERLSQHIRATLGQES
jgi:glycosyltransferase involved in cell wall biosynthesis